MAQRVIVTLEDDLGGGPADVTVHFAFGAAEYEFDLTAENAKAYRKKLAPFIEHARKAGRSQSRRPGRPAASRQVLGPRAFAPGAAPVDADALHGHLLPTCSPGPFIRTPGRQRGPLGVRADPNTR